MPRRPGTIARYAYRYRRFYLVGGLALLLVNVCDVALPLVLKLAIDDVATLRGAIPLWAVGALYLALVVVLAVYRYVWRLFFNGTAHRVANELRRALFEHLVTLSPSYFSRARTGDIMSRATGDLEAVRLFYNQGLLLTMDAAFYLAVMPPIMVYLSPRLTLLTLAPLPLLPFLVYFAGRAIRDRSRRARDLEGDLSAAVEETVAGVRVVKAFAQEERALGRLRETSGRLLEAGMSVAWVQGALGPAVAALMAIGVAVVIVAGGAAAIEGSISIGDFVAFQHYLLKFAWPMQAIGMIVATYQRAFASVKRIDEVLDARPEIADGPLVEPSARVESGAIELAGVTVAHPDALAPALRDVALAIPPGRTVALVGPIGAGKTTLLDLLPRLVEAAAGEVRIDGRDVRRYPLAELRRAIAYVPQETFLFADTIAWNVALGLEPAAPGEGGPPEREAVVEAARLACIHDEIVAAPGGYDAVLGERGVTLSGGQRQRIALARAIARRPRVLLLDDCLSSVDAETEARIVENLRGVLRGRTCLIASHRLAAARAADEIVVLDAGRVVERGTHADLLARGGAYARLFSLQRIDAA